jgi:hypothetical protein
MMNEHEGTGPGAVAEEKRPHKVEVTVNGKPRQIRPGTYVVADFKREVKVDPELALDQVKDGVFVPLDDTASIDIHGGEAFVSHVRQGGSS